MFFALDIKKNGPSHWPSCFYVCWCCESEFDPWSKRNLNGNNNNNSMFWFLTKKKISNSNYNTNNPITKQETGKDDRCWPFSNVKNKICSMKKQKKMISWDEKKRNFSWWTQCIQWPLYVSVLSIYLFIFGWLVSWLVDFFEFFSQKFFR